MSCLAFVFEKAFISPEFLKVDCYLDNCRLVIFNARSAVKMFHCILPCIASEEQLAVTLKLSTLM
jgi:hypothetical protein